MGHKQDAFVLAVGVVVRVDGRWVAVAEVDLPALGLGDLRGQGHLGARGLDAVLVCSQALDMDAMRERAPRLVLETIPLFQEVVAAVVTHTFNCFAVRDANLADVRRVDNQLAVVSQHRFELVHALAGSPQLIVHLRGTGEDGVERFRLDSDMALGREIGGGGPGLSTGPANSPLMPLLSTTMQKASFGILTIEPALSTTLRTGVHLWPMIFGVVITEASQ